MRIKNITSLVVLLLIFLQACNSSSGQEKKTAVKKAVCSSKIPSRFNAVSYYQKSDTTAIHSFKKKLSCCKGVPSRFNSLVSNPHQKQVQ